MKRTLNDREKTKMPVKTTSNQDDDYQLSDSDKKITTTRFYSLRGGVVKRSQEPEVIHLEDSEEEENQTTSQTSSSSSKKRRSSPENQNRQALNTSKTKKEEENKTLGNISTISAEATCSQKSISSENNKNNTIINKSQSTSSAATPSKQPNQDNIEPTSDESTCQANQVVKTKSKSNSIVCEKLNIKKRHLEKCALKMLDLISLEGSLELNCKYIQLGGFRNADPFTVKFHDNGEIQLDVNDDEDTISVILGDVDINFAAGFFFDPLFGIVFAIEESTAKMYINKLKELASYDNSIKPDHKSNSELILIFQITHEEENIVAQKLYLYFKKSCDMRRERQKTESNSSKKIDFNFGFLKESRAREVLKEAFLNREKPSEIEKFVGSYTPILPEQCIKYPLNSDSSLTITVEDLKCLKDGEFLNDNIISFYLKYIYHDLINEKDRKRTHIFDTFFYQRLTDGTRRKGEGFSNSPSKRHAKVKNWTRNVNIFEKDFLIVPINKRAHWFMAIICYPYLLEPVTDKEDANTNDEEQSSSQKSDKSITRSTSKKKWLDEFSQYISSDANKTLSTTSEATNETILDDDDNNSDYEKRVIKKMSIYKNCVKMPIILIFDSLSASKSHMVMNNLREYLIAEWKTRHPNDSEEEIDKYVKAFKELCGFCVRVPQQKNFYDCGIFMLQYVESFFQNPITKYDLPIRLDNWFDEEVTDSKREKIRRIIEDVAQKQNESKQEKPSKKD